jgi:hypothetical protein
MNRLIIYTELLWWAITAVVLAAVLWPIYYSGIQWPFLVTNILFAVLLITFSRHIFLLKYSLIGKNQLVKAVVFIALFPITFALISELNKFLIFADEQRMEILTHMLPFEQQRPLETYIWRQMVFFGIGSIISAPVLAGRLFMSVWKQYNNRKDEL